MKYEKTPFRNNRLLLQLGQLSSMEIMYKRKKVKRDQLWAEMSIEYGYSIYRLSRKQAQDFFLSIYDKVGL
jgi:hypothetical protein